MPYYSFDKAGSRMQINGFNKEATMGNTGIGPMADQCFYMVTDTVAQSLVVNTDPDIGWEMGQVITQVVTGWDLIGQVFQDAFNFKKRDLNSGGGDDDRKSKESKESKEAGFNIADSIMSFFTSGPERKTKARDHITGHAKVEIKDSIGKTNILCSRNESALTVQSTILKSDPVLGMSGDLRRDLFLAQMPDMNDPETQVRCFARQFEGVDFITSSITQKYGCDPFQPTPFDTKTSDSKNWNDYCGDPIMNGDVPVDPTVDWSYVPDDLGKWRGWGNNRCTDYCINYEPAQSFCRKFLQDWCESVLDPTDLANGIFQDLPEVCACFDHVQFEALYRSKLNAKVVEEPIKCIYPPCINSAGSKRILNDPDKCRDIISCNLGLSVSGSINIGQDINLINNCGDGDGFGVLRDEDEAFEAAAATNTGTDTGTGTEPEEEEESNDLVLVIGIIVGVVVLLVAGFFIVKAVGKKTLVAPKAPTSKGQQRR